jgi:outer membrane protein assembly factor BamB
MAMTLSAKTVWMGVALGAVSLMVHAAGERPFESSLSRWSEGMNSVSYPDDSAGARQAVLETLRGLAVQGSPPLLEMPSVRWRVPVPLATAGSVSWVEGELRVLQCAPADRRNQGSYALDTATGAVLRHTRDACGQSGTQGLEGPDPAQYAVESEGILYASLADAKHAGPPYRQLQAIDQKTGAVLWKHTDQAVIYQSGAGRQRASDAWPMVANGKVVFRLEGEMGWLTVDHDGPSSVSYRALDARTGANMWTTDPIGLWLRMPMARKAIKTQDVESQMLAGELLLAVVVGRASRQREVFAYRLGDGQPAWRRSLVHTGKPLAGPFAAVAANGLVYGLAGSVVMALDARTGTLLWQWDDPGATMVGVTVGPDGALYVRTQREVVKLQAR